MGRRWPRSESGHGASTPSFSKPSLSTVFRHNTVSNSVRSRRRVRRSMPTLVLLQPDGSEELRVEVPAGRLLDASDESGLGLSFGCRSANCGTCVVSVEAG